jgi:hypothetical protein
MSISKNSNNLQLDVGPKDIAENQVSVRTQNGEEKVRLGRVKEFFKKFKIKL